VCQHILWLIFASNLRTHSWFFGGLYFSGKYLSEEGAKKAFTQRKKSRGRVARVLRGADDGGGGDDVDEGWIVADVCVPPEEEEEDIKKGAGVHIIFIIC